jgi:Pvc16 N-terminal domain
VPFRAAGLRRSGARPAAPRPARVAETAEVLHDVDASLRSMVEAAVPRNGGLPLVSFEPPAPAWVEKQSDPTLSLFLFDVREDLSARMGDEVDVRDERGHVVGRRPPVRRYQLSYLVSAWAKDPEEEHRMLGAILATVPNSARIPDEHLKGRLVEQGLPVQIEVGVPATGAQLWDLWSALGTPPRTALELVVTAPFLPELDTDLAPPARELGLDVEKGGVGGGWHPSSARERAEAELAEAGTAAPPAPKRRAKRRTEDRPEETESAEEPTLPARPGKKWATFRVREHHVADVTD